MRTSTLVRAALLLAVVAALASFGVPAQAGEEKVDVCHITGTATVNGVPDTPVGHVITIAAPAYPAHIAHGDPEQWSMVTLDDGSEVCTPQRCLACEAACDVPQWFYFGLADYDECVNTITPEVLSVSNPRDPLRVCSETTTIPAHLGDGCYVCLINWGWTYYW
jgi:hypothetical protein